MVHIMLLMETTKWFIYIFILTLLIMMDLYHRWIKEREIKCGARLIAFVLVYIEGKRNE